MSRSISEAPTRAYGILMGMVLTTRMMSSHSIPANGMIAMVMDMETIRSVTSQTHIPQTPVNGTIAMVMVMETI